MIFKNETYDILKKVATLFAPISTLIIALLTAYGYADLERAIAVLAAINVFFGSLVEISSGNYKKSLDNNKNDSIV